MLVVFRDLGFLAINLSLLFIVYIAVLVLRMRRKSQIHYAFLTLMGTISIWALGAVFLTFDYLAGRPTNPRMVELAYVGLILTPVAVLFLGVVFAKTKIRLSWKHGLFLVVPLISLVMLFTNDQHQLFYRYMRFEDLTSAQALGSYFLLHTVYSYFCIVLGMWHLAYFSVKNAGFFSRQSILILLGIVISTGYNALLTFQVIEGYFYSNVIAFFFTFLLFYFAIFKYDFLNVVPVALQKVVDNISDGFLVLDKEGYVIDYNRTFASIFEPVLKVRRRENLSDMAESIREHGEIAALMDLFAAGVEKGEANSFERSVVIEGRQKHFSVEVTPIFNDQEVYLSTIVLLKDITQVKEALETIQRNHEILTEQERLASLGQLIGGIAHNLKTPIMSISGGIEALTDLVDEYERSVGDGTVTDEDHREIAAEMHEWVGKIRPHCAYMSDIISTVKGQAAQFNVNSQMSFTLDELIRRVDLLMKHELKRFHCELTTHFEADRYLEIHGEVNSLVQIFDNLIINGIHSYDGKRGVIDLTVRKENDGNVLFVFRDYGKGIPEAIQPKLFREMVTTKGKQGTGLGLYMSHATVKGRFGGQMWFESTEGEGTAFYMTIPLKGSTIRSMPEGSGLAPEEPNMQ